MSYTLALNSGPITGNEHKEGIYEVCKDLFLLKTKRDAQLIINEPTESNKCFNRRSFLFKHFFTHHIKGEYLKSIQIKE